MFDFPGRCCIFNREIGCTERVLNYCLSYCLDDLRASEPRRPAMLQYGDFQLVVSTPPSVAVFLPVYSSVLIVRSRTTFDTKFCGY